MKIKEVANRLGRSEQFIRSGIQKGMFSFGFAEKADGKYVYSIDEAAFNKFMSMIKVFENDVIKALTLNEVIAAIDPKNIVRMEIVPDRSYYHMVSVCEENADGDVKVYEFPACKGYQIHSINEFLRSLDLKIDIEFKTYEQYGKLLNECLCLLMTKERNDDHGKVSQCI